ncbi:MAG TPA: bifunctional ornithine acetyltransferase/N-acetylglutamate synthase, partial [Acidimicrobiales bacterium]
MSVTHPAGFVAAGAAIGLKASGNKDFALVVNQGPTFDSASVFTSNRCKANPVLWSEQVAKDGVVRAVVLNSGGANCYTGPEGFQTTHQVAEKVGELVGIAAGDVVVCSTGLIGLVNDRQRLLDGVGVLHAQLSADGGNDAAEAIMTDAGPR